MDGKAPQAEQPGGGAFYGTTKFFLGSSRVIPVFSLIVIGVLDLVFKVRVLN